MKMGYAESIAKAESRYSGADGEKQFTVVKDFSVMRIMPLGKNIRLAMPQPKAFKAGEVVTVAKVNIPVISASPVSLGGAMAKKTVAAQPVVSLREAIVVDGVNYNMPSPEFLKENVAENVAAEKTVATTDKFFLGMTKKTTIIVGVSVLVLAIGGFIYYKKFYKK